MSRLSKNDVTQHPNHFNLATIVNLTNGIFAVAMTLLVLDIRLSPDLGRQMLGSGLIHLLPRLYSYVVSFFVLALFWLTYHRVVAFIARADYGFVWWNITFLFSVTLLSFTAYLPGGILRNAHRDRGGLRKSRRPLGTAHRLLWKYAESHDFVDPQVPEGDGGWSSAHPRRTCSRFLSASGIRIGFGSGSHRRSDTLPSATHRAHLKEALLRNRPYEPAYPKQPRSA